MAICAYCGEHDQDVGMHLQTPQHRLNFQLYYRENHLNKFVHFRGIIIDQRILLNHMHNIAVQYYDKKGLHVTHVRNDKFLQLNCKLQYGFTLRNTIKDTVLIEVEKLYDLKAFYLSRQFMNNVETTKKRYLNYVLGEGEVCQFIVTYQPENNLNGTYKLPISIGIHPESNPGARKYLYRDIQIIIKDHFSPEDEDRDSPFRKKHWGHNINIIEPTNSPKHNHEYQIPNEFVRVYLHNFVTFDSETLAEQEYRLETLEIWKAGVNEKNYSKFFHRLLWLEECTEDLGIKQYNMSNVTVQLMHKCVNLEVPGLAEKRPSVLKGDLVMLRIVNDHTAYKGVVQQVQDECLVIEFLDRTMLKILEHNPHIELDVGFMLNRLQLERMHRGIDNSTRNGMLMNLFPQRPISQFTKRMLGMDELFNRAIGLNAQQLVAVECILSCTSQRAPYIIYGPPGTGKTVTLVEAILQVRKHYPNKHILVCAPSNAACDMLATKLHDQLRRCGKWTESALFRVHSGNRNIKDIPNVVKYFSNIDGDEINPVRSVELMRFSIIISTLHLIGKFVDDYIPEMVFIDEAAQTTEPDIAIPLGLITPDVSIVLAGDPKQLGPICGAPAAQNGLGRSLLDRLMEDNELYQPRKRRPLIYNNDYITMLKQNYRSHEDIVTVPNELFYDKALEFTNHRDPISHVCIAQRIICHHNAKRLQWPAEAAIEFIGVMSKEQRKGNSPSYYNDMEIEMVLKVVHCVLYNVSECRVVPEHIGVIAPYIRQVVKIRNRLTEQGLADVQVGTTEAFQGGERRIMIISTVRAQSDLLRYDKKYDLGFVKHERRFNVAITRAQSKLVIIGNPYVLGYDQICWGKLIAYCEDLKCYFGAQYLPRTTSLCQRLMKLLPHTKESPSKESRSKESRSKESRSKESRSKGSRTIKYQ